jgi:hypothetical protein
VTAALPTPLNHACPGANASTSMTRPGLRKKSKPGRQVHQYVLCCCSCGGLWDDAATDRVYHEGLHADGV